MKNNIQDQFAKRFGSISHESLTRASQESVHMLVDLIVYGDLQNYTKAIAVSSVGLSLDDQYISFLKSLTDDESPLVRESAYQSLVEYFVEDEKKYIDLYEYFQQKLEKESFVGVQKQIKSLIEFMDTYK